MVHSITVDDRVYSIRSTTLDIHLLLIECLDLLGSNIPNFCYNKYLSIAGNCRMCLIETLNAIKPLISCLANTKSYISNIIFTNSPLTAKSRENILEVLLVNHPIDCAKCDQAGHCDLQDYSLISGRPDKRFYSYKRIIEDKSANHIVKTSMARCIHCTRCTRFSAEVAGLKEIGVFNRGVLSEIGFYNLNSKLLSELSGNLVDICPVSSFTI